MTERELLELMDEAGIEYMTGCRRIYKLQITDLAKFIDEYFLPRPLFEDGTPVKVGDEFALHKPSRSEKAAGFCVHNDGSFSINGFLYDQDQRMKKHEENPEVLDADGVPIEVGDKLYFAEGDDTPLKCVGFDDYGNVTFTDWKKTGTIAYENPTVFTHKKPDSWEKIETDEKKSDAEYWGCEGEDEHPCFGCEHSFMETGKTCTMNKYIDLFRRAKALAGVDDE